MKPYIVFLNAAKRSSVCFAAFCICAVILFERAATPALLQRQVLVRELQDTQRQILLAQSINRQLKQELASSDDFEWVEMAMMRVLGVVPDGYQKIVFKEP